MINIDEYWLKVNEAIRKICTTNYTWYNIAHGNRCDRVKIIVKEANITNEVIPEIKLDNLGRVKLDDLLWLARMSNYGKYVVGTIIGIFTTNL